MTRTQKPHFCTFGPQIPIVPITNYSKVMLTREEMDNLWWLCGPTADRNMRNGLELWQVIAIAYMEGLNHGAGAARRIAEETVGTSHRIIQRTRGIEEEVESPWQSL